MSAALHEYRQRYRAAQARLWSPVKTAPQPLMAPPEAPKVEPEQPVVRDVLDLEAGTAMPKTTFEKAKAILIEVSNKHALTIGEIVGASRDKARTIARHELIWRLRMETTWSTTRIGRFVGGRDHSTVCHATRKHEERLASGEATL